MLTIVVPGEEHFDEEEEEFFSVGDVEVHLEHSLVSLSKWESKFQRPFLGKNDKTPEEVMYYIECMIVTPEISPEVISRLTRQNLVEITSYIESPQSATTFGEMPERKGRGETITSELIYYWLVAFNIPFEAQYWHLNRLFSLIRICNIKNQPPQKRSKAETARRFRELNEQRRAELKTTG